MKRKWVYISTTLMVGSIAILCFGLSNDDILTRKGFKGNLFNSSYHNTNLTCYKDLIGLTNDGTSFDFYEYKIYGLEESSLKGDYPNYQKIFRNSELSNLDFSFWKQTPIPKEIRKYHFDIAYSSNLSKSTCSLNFLNKELLSQSGNYYSFISAYPIGVYLLIYSPLEETLYVISKK